MIGIALLAIVISLIGYLIKYAHTCNQHWKKKGIKHLKPVLFFGNCFPLIRGKKNISEIIEELFNTYPDEGILGFYEFMSPRLLLRDPDIIKSVLIKDFSSFTDHGLDLDVEKNPREEQLFVMNGTKWRSLRTKLTPIFTSGKLKEMFVTMTSTGDNFLEYFRIREKEDIDVREVTGLFSMDIIGSAVYGMDPGTLKNPDNEFRQMGKKLTSPSFGNMVRMWMVMLFPQLMKKLGITFQDQKVGHYFGDIIEKTIEYRKEKGIFRNDFVQMMIQLKDKGNVEIQNWDANDDYLKSDESAPGQKVEFTNEVLMAQAQGFMINGFEGTGILMSYTLVELSQKPELQDQLREEIQEQMRIHGGINYESIKAMRLLEASIKETQRIYSVLAYLMRVCTKTHEFPNGYVIQKGETVSVPVAAVHMDPNNYPNPKVYDPTRFLEPSKPGTYLGFGDGPRICIAMRYTMLVMKYGLALLLLNYKIKLAPNITYPLKMSPMSFGAYSVEKLMIQLEKI